MWTRARPRCPKRCSTVLGRSAGSAASITAMANGTTMASEPAIRSALAKTPDGIRLLAEPGRFISAPAMTSISSVMGKAERFGRTWYYLDDGLYGSYSGQLFDHIDYPKSAPYAKGEAQPAVLAGPTCDSIDVIADDILLPQLEVGDLIVGGIDRKSVV